MSCKHLLHFLVKVIGLKRFGIVVVRQGLRVVSAGLRAGGKDVFDGAINRNDLYISLTKIHRPYLVLAHVQ